MERNGLRVLVFQKLPGIWVARGLEHDLAVEGGTVHTVVERISRLVNAHADFDRRHGRIPLSSFPAAPTILWKAFARSAPMPSQDQSSDAGPIAIVMALNLEDNPLRPLPDNDFQSPRILRRPRLPRAAY